MKEKEANVNARDKLKPLTQKSKFVMRFYISLIENNAMTLIHDN